MGRVEPRHVFGALALAQRSVRKAAFHQYYRQYSSARAHLAATLERLDPARPLLCPGAEIIPARWRRRCFPTTYPSAVYDNLIAAVHRHLPALHRYYDVRRRKMQLKRHPSLRHLRADPRRTWRPGTPGTRRCDVVIAALEPLGSEYCGVLEQGLRGRWCDRYENRGKQSGAFSAGSYDGLPYILMNYQPDVLDHVFTLAHEAGHSMHSYYSAKTQPYQYYNYVDLRGRSGQHVQRAASQPATCSSGPGTTASAPTWSTARSTPSGPRSSARRCSPSSRRSPTSWPRRASRSRSTGSRRSTGSCCKQYFGPEFALDDELKLGMPAHSALLSGVLRLQVRHGHVGRDRPGRARDARRPAGARSVSGILGGRLLEIPVGATGGRRGGHATSPARSTPRLRSSAGWSRNSTRCSERPRSRLEGLFEWRLQDLFEDLAAQLGAHLLRFQLLPLVS